MAKFIVKHRLILAFTILLFLSSSIMPIYASKKPEMVKPASRPTDCQGDILTEVPANCLFLSEPIGGTIGYDLFTKTCTESSSKPKKVTCKYKPWRGENITGEVEGPFQAILSFQAESPDTGGLGLLYSYVSLIYQYLSGIIVAMVVLFIIIGGIQMTTSAGNQSAFDEGRKRITNALVGMVIWFLASLILYTINPTFFAF